MEFFFPKVFVGGLGQSSPQFSENIQDWDLLGVALKTAINNLISLQCFIFQPFSLFSTTKSHSKGFQAHSLILYYYPVQMFSCEKYKLYRK